MLCAIYKSPKKSEMYLYIEKRDEFSVVPEALLQQFGKPELVMLFNLVGEKQLQRVGNQEVIRAIQEQGFYLQMPPPPENLYQQFIESQEFR
ncbi:hypothetical protein EV693_10548 [Nicoletella semolina]|uniref:YcgL domain-containing protein EV693_10548 n=1 Tax=Nicoletella semolina TaxID=271160 RepID=A0A4R2N997_9PAST|nr:YcgL domain-containing protein [Nicoletella semolina]MDH2925509.1 hypothetical protein [Nicoletella semolina]TCP17584.1 hypothetical protein EV693_10548 [Nicoletella semolina]